MHSIEHSFVLFKQDKKIAFELQKLFIRKQNTIRKHTHSS